MDQRLVIAAMAVGALGCLLYIIGNSTTEWAFSCDELNAGIFVACYRSTCGAFTAEGSVYATRAFVAFGVICSLIALIITIVYYVKYVRKETVNLKLPLVAAIFFVIASVLAILGAIVFGTAGKSEMERDVGRQLRLGYSFALTIVGGLICGGAGAVMFIHRSSVQS